MTTLYDTLGVNEHASAEELKRAYRKAMMRWHPDRNAGNEAAAHAAFQEVKAAYAILSDPAQRHEYDTIFAAEMRRWAQQHAADLSERDEAGESRETREQRASDEAEARYAEHVALAMRFAGQGYNRDVVFGVLLGRQCEAFEAQRIADSVSAWHAPQAPARTPASGTGRKPTRKAAREATARRKTDQASLAPTTGADEQPEAAHTALHPGHAFSQLWYHFLNGLKL
jgi:curved DNA-binding protein CbpA